MKLLVLVLVSLSVAGSALAQDAKPSFPDRAVEDDRGSHYPARAQKENVSGRVVLRCAAHADGSLSECTVMSELPRDYGFGDAALNMASLFQMKAPPGGFKPGAMVNLPINFKPPVADANASAPSAH